MFTPSYPYLPLVTPTYPCLPLATPSYPYLPVSTPSYLYIPVSTPSYPWLPPVDMFLVQIARRRLADEKPELRNTELSKILGQMWKVILLPIILLS